MKEARTRGRGSATVTSKHQITLPVDALREVDVITELAGSLTGVYEVGELATLRDEWGSTSGLVPGRRSSVA